MHPQPASSLPSRGKGSAGGIFSTKIPGRGGEGGRREPPALQAALSCVICQGPGGTGLPGLETGLEVGTLALGRRHCPGRFRKWETVLRPGWPLGGRLGGRLGAGGGCFGSQQLLHHGAGKAQAAGQLCAAAELLNQAEFVRPELSLLVNVADSRHERAEDDLGVVLEGVRERGRGTRKRVIKGACPLGRGEQEKPGFSQTL